MDLRALCKVRRLLRALELLLCNRDRITDKRGLLRGRDNRHVECPKGSVPVKPSPANLLVQLSAAEAGSRIENGIAARELGEGRS